MEREILPADLRNLTARELRDFLRRGFREQSQGEIRRVYEEMRRRGIYLQQSDYGQVIRLTKGKTPRPEGTRRQK